MAQLLERLGIDRGAVAPWAEDAVPEVIPARGRFANLALRPPGGTARWHSVTPGSFAGALEGVRRVDCADPGDEALVIALLRRRGVEKPRRTAAPVQPDRELARRVPAHLDPWHTAVDNAAVRRTAHKPPQQADRREAN